VSKVVTLGIMCIANDRFNAGKRCLALDVARAASEGRVCWRIESNLRSLTEDESRTLFDDLEEAVGEGASASKVYQWLDQRFPTTYVKEA
jgi:hypothetical protein